VSSIDLNKLVFNTSSCRYAYNYLLQKGVNSIPGYLSYVDDSWNVNIPLCDIQYINKGSFGVVLSYAEHDVLPDGWAEVKDPSKNGLTYYHNIKTNEKTWIRPPGRKLKPQIKVALKTFKNHNDPELKVINDLNRLGINCNTVNSKVLSRKNSKGGMTTVAVMDIMNGSLGNLKGKIDLNTVLNIIQKLAIDLECLNSKKLAYTDLKTGNILFKCIDGNILKIVLGDLGSICPQGRSNSITYPPPEFRFPNKTSVICNESTMVWGLGIIFLELLNIDVYRPFYHGTISKYTAQQFNKTLRDTVVLASDRYSM
jgi:serine/threonine protein kinase